jgi:hypothetical protein
MAGLRVGNDHITRCRGVGERGAFIYIRGPRVLFSVVSLC